MHLMCDRKLSVLACMKYSEMSHAGLSEQQKQQHLHKQ